MANDAAKVIPAKTAVGALLVERLPTTACPVGGSAAETAEHSTGPGTAYRIRFVAKIAKNTREKRWPTVKENAINTWYEALGGTGRG